MIPSLFTFTLLAAAVLLLAGVPFLAVPGRIETAVRAFPRCRVAGIVLMLVGGGWFLWKITQLGQSDFGDYKNLLLVLFGATLVGTIVYVTANVGLKSAFGLYDIPARLVLVTILYVFIVAAIYTGVVPYKMRDFIGWLYAAPARPRLLGLVFVLMGSGLIVSALQY